LKPFLGLFVRQVKHRWQLTTAFRRGFVLGSEGHMKLPLVFSLKVDCPQGGDLSGLVFDIVVTAGTKNRYHIMLPKTSRDGTTQITEQDFREQFKAHGDLFLMDYDGSIEIASDWVTFELYDQSLMEKNREQLSRWPLSKYRRTKWKSRQGFVEYLLSARNREFYFDKLPVKVPIDGVVHLTVTRKIDE
jgi:hypothetical protein